MSTLQALILGCVQGLTEFVPVSSTAHLYLAQVLLGIRNDMVALSFDVLLHLGTALALAIAFRRELAALIAEAVRWARGRPPADPEGRAMLWPLIVGTVPGVLAGVLLLKRFEELRSVLVIGVTMLVASVYFFLAEAAADRRREPERPLRDLRAADGLWIGLAQAAAGLMAGLSRSGLTIATGRLRRLNRPDAARFSFVLALPIILGAGAKALLDLRKVAGPRVSGSVLFAGFAASAIVGYFAIEFMLTFVRRHSLRPFGVYLAVLGLLLVLAAVLPVSTPFSRNPPGESARAIRNASPAASVALVRDHPEPAPLSGRLRGHDGRRPLPTDASARDLPDRSGRLRAQEAPRARPRTG